MVVVAIYSDIELKACSTDVTESLEAVVAMGVVTGMVPILTEFMLEHCRDV